MKTEQKLAYIFTGVAAVLITTNVALFANKVASQDSANSNSDMPDGQSVRCTTADGKPFRYVAKSGEIIAVRNETGSYDYYDGQSTEQISIPAGSKACAVWQGFVGRATIR